MDGWTIFVYALTGAAGGILFLAVVAHQIVRVRLHLESYAGYYHRRFLRIKRMREMEAEGLMDVEVVR